MDHLGTVIMFGTKTHIIEIHTPNQGLGNFDDIRFIFLEK